MLNYFHTELCPAVAGDLTERDVIEFSSNVDVQVVDKWFPIAKEAQQREVLLQVGSKYYYQMKAKLEKTSKQLVDKMPVATRRYPWMEFTDPAEKQTPEKTEKKKPEEAIMNATILRFDEKTGELLNKQDTKSQAEASMSKIQLPWKVWCNAAASKNLNIHMTDTDAIGMAMSMLHINNSVVDQPIDVVQDQERKANRVIVTRDCDAEEVVLPPCNPKAHKYLQTCESEKRVPVIVKRRPILRDEEALLDDAAIKTSTYYMIPEWKGPEEVETTDPQQKALGIETEWKWKGEEAMHPLWAVRRLTENEISRENAKYPRSLIGITCEWQYTDYTIVTVGKRGNETVSMTVVVQLPLLTNKTALEKGTELIVEQTEIKAKPKQKAVTWKHQADKKRRVAKMEADACTKGIKKVKGDAEGVKEL